MWSAPVVQPVTSRKRFENPHINGKRFEPAGAEEEHAIGNFFADARQETQAFLRYRVGQRFGFFEPAGMRGEKTRGLRDVPRTKSQQTRSQFGFRNLRELGPGWQPVKRNWRLSVERRVAYGE